jgi:hypothetical protein
MPVGLPSSSFKIFLMKNQKTEQTVAAPVASQVMTGKPEAKQTKYVVVRDGYRVSDREYDSADAENAVAEKEFWTRVAKKHSHGEPVGIVQYEAKKHRVW